MATDDNDKILDPERDPNVSTVSDIPEEVPNELPHQSWFLNKHGKIERNATLLLALSFAVVTIGGAVEIAPLFYLENTIEEVDGMRPYSPAGASGARDLHPRGLLCLPQPDDPPAAGRG